MTRSMAMATKLANLLEVSLDYLVGQTTLELATHVLQGSRKSPSEITGTREDLYGH
ncbi:MAG: hypothetical protein AAGA86_16130 [Bacteroidota bacterium]